MISFKKKSQIILYIINTFNNTTISPYNQIFYHTQIEEKLYNNWCPYINITKIWKQFEHFIVSTQFKCNYFVENWSPYWFLNRNEFVQNLKLRKNSSFPNLSIWFFLKSTLDILLFEPPPKLTKDIHFSSRNQNWWLSKHFLSHKSCLGT